MSSVLTYEKILEIYEHTTSHKLKECPYWVSVAYKNMWVSDEFVHNMYKHIISNRETIK